MKTYKFYLAMFEEHKLDLFTYEHIDDLLCTLKSRIEELYYSFYVDFISEFADSHILKSSLYPITLNDEKNYNGLKI